MGQHLHQDFHPYRVLSCITFDVFPIHGYHGRYDMNGQTQAPFLLPFLSSLSQGGNGEDLDESIERKNDHGFEIENLT